LISCELLSVLVCILHMYLSDCDLKTGIVVVNDVNWKAVQEFELHQGFKIVIYMNVIFDLIRNV